MPSTSPVNRAPQEKDAPSSAGSTSAGNELADKPILVVEDDPASAKLCAIVLRAAGAKVTIAPSAEDALSLLEALRPRAAVIDLVLPRMSGLALAQWIRQNDSFADVVIVAVSALNGPEIRRIAREFGCNAYVEKPIDVDTFAGLVASTLGPNR